MATNSERQRKHREAQIAKGLVQCNVWLPPSVCADLRQAAELMQADPDLTVRLWNRRTGRVVSIRGAK